MVECGVRVERRSWGNGWAELSIQNIASQIPEEDCFCCYLALCIRFLRCP
jgi:hypothetical protein